MTYTMRDWLTQKGEVRVRVAGQEFWIPIEGVLNENMLYDPRWDYRAYPTDEENLQLLREMTRDEGTE